MTLEATFGSATAYRPAAARREWSALQAVVIFFVFLLVIGDHTSPSRAASALRLALYIRDSSLALCILRLIIFISLFLDEPFIAISTSGVIVVS